MTSLFRHVARGKAEASAPELGGFAGAVQSWLGQRGSASRHMRLIETIPLGARRSIALLECDGQRFLIGMSANGVETMLPAGSPLEPRTEVAR